MKKNTKISFLAKVLSLFCFYLVLINNGMDQPVFKVYAADVSSGDDSLKINLTPEEKNWLDAHRTIRVAGPKAFPPFHYYDENGNLKGIASDYLANIFKKLNITAKIHSNLLWPEVLSQVRSKQIDLIACLAKGGGS